MVRVGWLSEAKAVPVGAPLQHHAHLAERTEGVALGDRGAPGQPAGVSVVVGARRGRELHGQREQLAAAHRGSVRKPVHRHGAALHPLAENGPVFGLPRLHAREQEGRGRGGRDDGRVAEGTDPRLHRPVFRREREEPEPRGQHGGWRWTPRLIRRYSQPDHGQLHAEGEHSPGEVHRE